MVNFAAQVNGQLMADSKIQNPKLKIDLRSKIDISQFTFIPSQKPHNHVIQ